MVERKEIKIGKLETKTGSQSFTEKFIVVNGPTCLEVYGCDADHRGIVERFGLNQSQVLGGAAYSFRDGELLIRNQSEYLWGSRKGSGRRNRHPNSSRTIYPRIPGQ